MVGTKKTIIYWKSFILLKLVFLILISSCVPSSSTKRGTGKSSDPSKNDDKKETGDPNDPKYSSELNFLQLDQTKSSSSFNLNIGFNGGFYLRGKEVNNYISAGNTSAVRCLVSYYPTSIQNKILVTAAIPQFFYNFTEGTREYYYLLSPSNKSSNNTFCLKTGLLNTLSKNFPAATSSYSLVELCPNCGSSSFSSQLNSVSIFSPDGISLPNINTSYLTFNLLNTLSGSSSTLSCQASSECTGKGFDCCSSGQCVKDKQIKSSTDINSSEFLQAQSDINTNNNNIKNYPQFFHLCSQDVITPPVNEEDNSPNSQTEALKRITELEELYSCVTPSKGEMAFCTMTYENATSNGLGISYFTTADDKNFTGTYSGTTGILSHSIAQVVHADEVLYKEETNLPLNIIIGPGNDNLFDKSEVTLNHNANSSADNDTLKIRFKIDGSCEKITSTLSTCKKHYTQKQNIGLLDDHFPESNTFKIPLHADLTRTLDVKIDGNKKVLNQDWQLIQSSSPATVNFLGANLKVFEGQEVVITYFVNTSTNLISIKKEEALQKIRSVCSCGNTMDCRLKPVYSTNGATVVDYSCVYPKPDLPPPPLQQTVILSTKSVPHRYHDTNGALHDEVTPDTPQQEGNEFKYIGGNLLKPNNIDNYVGFNELYGSFSALPGNAIPAKMVRVESGKTYDIYTSSGTFSSCYFCGTDYYSNIAPLFPHNFITKGGGYEPLKSQTDRFTSHSYRADDLIFGRACFLPATMIPWTHSAYSDKKTQRQNRLSAQHFLFANGYNRDWFGFDYASVIGSFDGNRWFSIGNQRRIKAKSNKLYLALNAYFGDLTIEGSYSINVLDASSIPENSGTITKDINSEGAQCQKYHICNTDSDCASNLGWDYKCIAVSSATTSWPTFDLNGAEIPGTQKIERLVGLFDITVGSQSKRCVYRGRGTPCIQNYTTTNNTFSGTDFVGLHTCSSNNYCQVFSQTVSNASFNNRISRYGKSVKVQNSSATVAESDLDTFGLGARLIGRPYEYIGKNTIPNSAHANFTTNNVSAICLPGRNPNVDTLLGSHSNTPASRALGDKVTGIGITKTGNLASEYMSSCSIFDEQGNYFSSNKDNAAKVLSDTELVKLASTQTIPTNSLKLLQSITGKSLLKNFEVEIVTKATHEENRCLRAPGSVCHTNLDCSPSQTISSKAKSLNTLDSSLFSTMNFYEIRFWQEELICSQPDSPEEEDYSLSNNRCCREVGNRLTLGTFIDQANGFTSSDPSIHDFDNTKIPGTEIDIGSAKRYSRMAPVHSLRKEQPATYPNLTTTRKDWCNPTNIATAPVDNLCKDKDILKNQFNTFSEVATKTCCTKNWVRNFHTQNGGGHTWSPSKMQNIKKENFQCLNWSPDPTGGPYLTCAHVDDINDPGCFAKATSTSTAKRVFNWMNSLELLGIPQIAIKTEDFSDIDCSIRPGSPDTPGSGFTIPNFIKSIIDDSAWPEYKDITLAAGSNRYYSADDMGNFNNDLKPVFSPDEVSCCLPAGSKVEQGADPNLCCTGFINQTNNSCALQDYTNLTVYLNKYVSSEANNINPSLFDDETGFITNPSTIEALACQKNLCASGVLMRGISLSNLKVTGQENSTKLIKRFIDGNTQANNSNGIADLFDAGLRWNNDVYCVPTSIQESVTGNASLPIIDCN